MTKHQGISSLENTIGISPATTKINKSRGSSLFLASHFLIHSPTSIIMENENDSSNGNSTSGSADLESAGQTPPPPRLAAEAKMPSPAASAAKAICNNETQPIIQDVQKAADRFAMSNHNTSTLLEDADESIVTADMSQLRVGDDQQPTIAVSPRTSCMNQAWYDATAKATDVATTTTTTPAKGGVDDSSAPSSLCDTPVTPSDGLPAGKTLKYTPESWGNTASFSSSDNGGGFCRQSSSFKTPYKKEEDDTLSKTANNGTPTTEDSFFSDGFIENETKKESRLSYFMCSPSCRRVRCILGLFVIVGIIGSMMIVLPKTAIGKVNYVDETSQPTAAPGPVAGTFTYINTMRGPKSQGCAGSVVRPFDQPVLADGIRVQVESYVNWPSLRVGFIDVNGEKITPASQSSSSQHKDYTCAAINGALSSEDECDDYGASWSWCAKRARTGDFIDFHFDEFVTIQSLVFEGRQKGNQWGYVQSMQVFAAVETPSPTQVPTKTPTTMPTAAPTARGAPKKEKAQQSPTKPSPSSTPPTTLEPTTLKESSDLDVYVPGHLTQMKLGVRLSNGLDIRIVANAKRPVMFNNGTSSKIVFHERPDFGATFSVPDNSTTNKGGWIYMSNSEIEKVNGEAVSGGVGKITFNRYGKVIGYDMILSRTDRNCGGGVTPWDTYISCEESRRDPPVGHCFQLDPFSDGLQRRTAARTVLGGKNGGSFESFAHDATRNTTTPRFFVTEDLGDGALRRFTPTVVDWETPSRMLHDETGILDYLVLIPFDEEGRNGTFEWTTNQDRASRSAQEYYPNSEGIDVANGILYFVSKKDEDLFILDLDNGTYKRKIVKEEGIDVSPDQLIRLGGDDGIMYITEDGGEQAGIHGRDAQGRYFTILESPIYKEETTGLAFSPNKKHMYLAYQKNGILFDVWRRDGKKFDGATLNIKYHHQYDGKLGIPKIPT